MENTEKIVKLLKNMGYEVTESKCNLYGHKYYEDGETQHSDFVFIYENPFFSKEGNQKFKVSLFNGTKNKNAWNKKFKDKKKVILRSGNLKKALERIEMYG